MVHQHYKNVSSILKNFQFMQFPHNAFFIYIWFPPQCSFLPTPTTTIKLDEGVEKMQVRLSSLCKTKGTCHGKSHLRSFTEVQSNMVSGSLSLLAPSLLKYVYCRASCTPPVTTCGEVFPPRSLNNIQSIKDQGGAKFIPMD